MTRSEVFKELEGLKNPLVIDDAEIPEEEADKTYYQAGYNKAISDVLELLEERWDK